VAGNRCPITYKNYSVTFINTVITTIEGVDLMKERIRKEIEKPNMGGFIHG
jgi:hypothetical protein